MFKTELMKLSRNLLFFSWILLLSCQDKAPVELNTDFKLELKTRTFGAGAGYLISNQGIISKDGKIEFRDLKVEDAVRKLLCEYQNINCNGTSSKVIIKNPNKTLANYVFIDDDYKGARADQDIISQAIMKKLEEARLLTVNERVREIPRYIVEAVNEKRLKQLKTAKDKYFENQIACKANQTERHDNPSKAVMKNMGTLTKFIGDLSFCLGVDIFVADEIKYMPVVNQNMLFDINTTDKESELTSKLKRLGITVKKYMVQSKYYEINITPYMVNLTKEGQKRK